MKRNQNAVKLSRVFLVNFLYRRLLRSLRFSLTKKRSSCCRNWPGRTDWLCDDFYNDFEDEKYEDEDDNGDEDDIDEDCLTKKRLSCCRSWPGRMDWLCDD